MKQILTTLAIFCVLGASAQVSNDFNTDDGGWEAASSPSGTFWEWGIPNATQINDDNEGGGNAWVTELDGEFTNTSYEVLWLTSQSYDLSSFTTGTVSFGINYDLYFNTGFGEYDAMQFLYSTDSSNWSILGSEGTGTNWYNGAGFSGDGWTENSGGWLQASHAIPSELFGEGAVYFRFEVQTNVESGAYGHEGFAFDSFVLSNQSSDSEILTMSLTEAVLPIEVDSASRTIKIVVDPATDVTSLAPTFTISTGAMVDKASGSTQDFTNPVEYVVTAENTSFSSTWTVSVVNPQFDLALFPTSGIPGTELTIFGQSFSTTTTDNVVTLGGQSVTVNSATANKLTITIPSDASLGRNTLSIASNASGSYNDANFNVLLADADRFVDDYTESDFNFNVSVVNTMAVGDFDKDGDVDVAFDDFGNLKIATLENGRVSSIATIATSRSEIADLTSADINGDGYLDVVAAGESIGWFENNGDGTFASELTVADTDFDYGIKVFDADGDYDLDIITASGSGVSLFKNSGGGTFAEVMSPASGIGIPVDWDADGDIDMVSTNASRDAIILMANDGSGVFTDSDLLTGLSNLDFVQVGDLDNDDDLDLIFSTYDQVSTFTSTVEYSLNDGTGTMGTAVKIVDEGDTFTEKMDLGDFDGDGDLDIVRVQTDGSSQVLQGFTNNALTFSAPTVIESQSDGKGLVIVDIDQDGDLDILHEASLGGGNFPLHLGYYTSNDVTSFAFPESTGNTTIDDAAFTIEVEVTNGADITALTPTIELSAGATVSPESGVAQDFSASVNYTVTAEDGTEQIWVVTVISVPSAPNLTFDASQTSSSETSLTWNETANTESYSLEVSEANDFSSFLTGYDPLTISEPSVTEEIVSSLDAGSYYYARIRATNSIGTNSDYSDTVAILTKPADPVLTDADTADITQTSIGLSWEYDTTVFDTYDIEVSDTVDFTTLLADYPVTLDTSTFVIGVDSSTTALSPNTEYFVRVSIRNATGISGYSNVISAFTKPNTPTLTDFATDDINQTTARLSWDPVSGGTDSYSLELSSTDFTTATTLLTDFPVSVTDTTFEFGVDQSTAALESATEYWVRMKTENSSGLSGYSNVVSFLTRPATVNATTASDITTTSFSANWDAVTGADSYYLEVSSDDFASTVFTETLTTELTTSITGLSSASNYKYRVSAINATGSAPASNEISVLTLPDAPVVNSIANADITQSTFDLSWAASSGEIDNYIVEVSSTDFSVDTTLLADYPLTVTGTSLVIGSDLGTASLDPGSDYWILVRANNATGESDNSNVVTALTIPSDPVGSAATNILANSFTANWSSVVGVDGYNIQVLDNNSNTVFNDSTVLTSQLIDNLADGTQYRYRIRAYNATGASGFSDEIIATTNENPGVPSLSPNNVDENVPVGSFVGLFSTQDDASTSFVYSLVTGNGDDDNGLFFIDGDTLKTNAVFNHEQTSSFSVRVQTDDGFGGVNSGEFAINVNDVNEAPNNITFTLTSSQFTGYDAVETIIGTFQAEDEDESDNVFTFEVVDGSDYFEVGLDSRLFNTAVFETEIDSTITISVRASDDNDPPASITREFDIFIEAFVDREDPVIVPNPLNPTNLLSGGNPVTLEATVTDFRIGEVRFYSKLLTDTVFTSQVITGTNNVYSITIAEEDMGLAGIEYYFGAVDAAGNDTISTRTGLALEYEGGSSSPIVESVQRFGRTVDNYQVLSIPFRFEGNANRVIEIFDEYTSGIPDNKTWRIIRYDSNLDSLINLTATSEIQLGEAYFFIAVEQQEITVGAASINLQDPFPIELKAGWNLIGNPYNLDVDWNSVRDNNNANGIVGPLRVLDPNNNETWPTSTVLRKFEGAFVQVTEDITLNISYADAILSLGRMEQYVEEEDPEIDWYLPITITQDEEFRSAGIGMDIDADLAFDGLDRLQIPRWFEYLEFSSVHQHEKFRKFNRDIVPLSDRYVWDIEVSSSTVGASTISWDAEEFNSGYLKLLDKSTGRVIDMRENSSIQVHTDGVTELSIMYTTNPNDTFEFDEIAVMAAYPNPMDYTMFVPVSLPSTGSSYDINMEIIDLSGKQIFSNQIHKLGGGNYQFEITPDNQIPSGMYIYKVSVISDGIENVYTQRISVK